MVQAQRAKKSSKPKKKAAPAINEIKVTFDDTVGEGGEMFPVGNMTVTPAEGAPIDAGPVTGGRAKHILTHPGSHTVTHKKGAKGMSGEFGVPVPFAIYFYKGEAVHVGSVNSGSHACVHNGNRALMEKVNGRTVPGKTKVVIEYEGDTLKKLTEAQAAFKAAEKARKEAEAKAKAEAKKAAAAEKKAKKKP